jgi:uncharacterized protein
MTDQYIVFEKSALPTGRIDAAAHQSAPILIRVADRFWLRCKGLLGYTQDTLHFGLWIIPCRGVHTIGMRMPIDIIFLNTENQIIALHPCTPPFRHRFCFKAHSTLEFHCGFIQKNNLQIGNQLKVYK